jgi:hypothetical protein
MELFKAIGSIEVEKKDNGKSYCIFLINNDSKFYVEGACYIVESEVATTFFDYKDEIIASIRNDCLIGYVREK